MAHQVSVHVRPEGRSGFVVGYRVPMGMMIDLARYVPEVDAGETPTREQWGVCKAQAEAHKQGIIEGLRVAHNYLESVTP